MATTTDRVAVIGAGPVGLYTAFRLVQAGHRVVIWEKGCVGAAVESWGHVTLFSAMALNLPADARKALEVGLEGAPPRYVAGGDAFLTGAEFRRDVLLPLAAYLEATGRCTISEHTAVTGLARGHLLKKEGIGAIGDDRRETLPFRALLQRGDDEAWEEALAVVDCSGTYAADTAQKSGSGGLAAPGEVRAEKLGFISRVIPQPGSFAGKRVAVLGGGFSAITTLRKLVDEAPGPVDIKWLVRKAKTEAPYARVDGDPLPQRDALAAFGNGLAGVASMPTASGGSLTCVRGARIARVDVVDKTLQLTLTDATVVETDHLVSLTGYRPNSDLYRELHVHQCYASDGPMKLAATLLAAAAGGGGGDCLKQAAPGAATLRNPEPRFYILGMKSYGRNSSFLMRVGYEQVSLLVDELQSCATLEPFQGPPGAPDPPVDNVAPGLAVPVA